MKGLVETAREALDRIFLQLFAPEIAYLFLTSHAIFQKPAPMEHYTNR